jgi:hypothetical protein
MDDWLQGIGQRTARPRDAACSFCLRNYREVGPLVEGPGPVYICGPCVRTCYPMFVNPSDSSEPPKHD